MTRSSFLLGKQIVGFLAGLFHDIMLKKLGHNVYILEQSASSIRESQVAGITARPNVQTFLGEYNHCQLTHFLLSASVKVFDKNLRSRIYSKMPLQNIGSDVLYYHLRANYDGFKSKHVPNPLLTVLVEEGKAAFDWRKCVTNIKQESDKSVINKFDDLIDEGHRQHCVDLIIAGDRANSVVRRLVLPSSQIKRFFARYVAWKSIIAERKVSKETNCLFNHDNGAIITLGGYIMV